jgi:hypothetical protein
LFLPGLLAAEDQVRSDLGTQGIKSCRIHSGVDPEAVKELWLQAKNLKAYISLHWALGDGWSFAKVAAFQNISHRCKQRNGSWRTVRQQRDS